MVIKTRKIGVLGPRGVGKSSLIIQFVENQFADSYYPTIENTFTKVIKFHNQEYACEIIDTAGQDEYSILNSRHAIGIHGYILVYSIQSKSSFDILPVIRDKILNYTGTDWVPIVIVGNKCDLTAQRQVSYEELQKLANEWNAAGVEASAKQNQNVTEIFQQILEKVEGLKASDGSNGDKKAASGGCIVS